MAHPERSESDPAYHPATRCRPAGSSRCTASCLQGPAPSSAPAESRSRPFPASRPRVTLHSPASRLISRSNCRNKGVGVSVRRIRCQLVPNQRVFDHRETVRQRRCRVHRHLLFLAWARRQHLRRRFATADLCLPSRRVEAYAGNRKRTRVYHLAQSPIPIVFLFKGDVERV